MQPVENTGMTSGSENSWECVIHSDSHFTYFIYLFSLCAKVRVLPARPAPRLKVQFYQMAQPTPAAAPAPAISRALPQSMSTPSSPVL